MSTVDERIDRLLHELSEISKAYDFEKGLDILDDDGKVELINSVKKFMQDMGENIVKVQAIDEFVEYAEKRGIETGSSMWFMSMYSEDFKREKGYES